MPRPPIGAYSDTGFVQASPTGEQLFNGDAVLDKSVERNLCSGPAQLAVIWIDWYAYHLARFQALVENDELSGKVAGIELVGGIGVHQGLKFRQEIPTSLPVKTLLPGVSWLEASGRLLASKLWQHLNSLNPSLVLVPGYYTVPAIAAAVWGKFHGKTTVLMSESTSQDHLRSWWKESIKRVLLRTLFDWAIVGGSPHKRYLTELGFPSGRIAQFYDVVDNAFFRERCQTIRNTKKPQDFDLPSHYFLFVGRLAEEKNLDALLGAYFDYRRSGGSWALVLVGDGPLNAQLRGIALASPFSADIVFAGLKTAAELPEYYAFAETFVLPSAREPWGLVVNEAMASGLPVIVSHMCGCAEDLVSEGKNGFTFDPATSADLASRMLALAQLPPQSRKQMGRESLRIIARFSTAAWANEIARIASL